MDNTNESILAHFNETSENDLFLPLLLLLCLSILGVDIKKEFENIDLSSD